MTKALLVGTGFLGDNLFISSVAEKLLEERRVDSVDFFTGFPQVYPLLENNPFISNVYITPEPTQFPGTVLNQYDLSSYDFVFKFPNFSFAIQPPMEAQLFCGIQNTSPTFKVYTDPNLDEVASNEIQSLRSKFNKPVVAWMKNWKQKAFRFTEHEYWTASNDPQGLTGYGKENRNIEHIIDKLSEHFTMIPVGVSDNMNQFDTAKDTNGYRTFSEEASLLKQCDYFIGAEGGLANLAYGVGCKTILTHEFGWQCYGPRGVIRPFKNGPMLGPAYYDPANHVYLPLYKTDEELVELIKERIQ